MTLLPGIVARGRGGLLVIGSGAGVATAVSSAGGTLVASYPQIDVVVARSANPAFADAIEDYLRRETAGIARYVDELNEHSPFRAPSSPPPSAPCRHPGGEGRGVLTRGVPPAPSRWSPMSAPPNSSSWMRSSS